MRLARTATAAGLGASTASRHSLARVPERGGFSMTANEFRPDKLWMERAFDRAAAHYDDAAVLQREVAGRLLERMDWVRLAPGSILDLGAGTGWLTAKLRERYRKAQIVALDRSHAMLRRAQRRASWSRSQPCVRVIDEAPHFAAESFDLVMSNFL